MLTYYFNELKRPPKKGKTNIQCSLVVDGNSLLKTAYHGAKDLNYKGSHIGGIYQFMTIIRKLLNEKSFDRVIIFWDGPFSGKLRYDIYPEYKLNRGKNYETGTIPTDESLLYQKNRVKLYCEELFIRWYENDIVESDDCIAYYCLNKKDNEKIVICSNDRDLSQLINDDISIYFLNKKKIITKDNYRNHFNHHHTNSALIKIIEGDSSDNIKGIKGVKEKTLLKHIPDLSKREVIKEELFHLIEEIQSERKTRLKSLDNILNGVSDGTQGDNFYLINESLVNLKKPLLTQECVDDIDELINSPIDPDDRGTKKLLKLMMEDGILDAISNNPDGHIEYLRPFLRIMEKEKRFFEDNISI